MRHPRATLLGASALILTWAASTLSADEISEFVAKVEATPAWALLNDDKLKKHAPAINEIGKEFQNFPLDKAQEIIKQLQARAYADKATCDPIASVSRAYVLLRFYYAVPEYEDQDKVRFFGGWAGVEERDNQFNILYPLRQNEDGSVEVSKPFGGYFGPGYNAVRELEHFNRSYGPRKKAAAKQD